MKIKISLEKTGEWSDCWFVTKYVGEGDITFETWLYPTIWPDSYRIDGFYQNMWIKNKSEVRINMHKYIDECREHLKPKEEKNERIATTLQKAWSIFKRIFTWKY